MKSLVVFYSRTGVTTKVARDIKNLLLADIEQVLDLKDRSGAKGWLIAGKDASFKKTTQINPLTKDPANYDLVVIGTPVWAFTMACAIRQYIEQNKQKFKTVAFFCTQGSTGSKSTFQEMEKICAKKAIGLLELSTKEVVSNSYSEKAEGFVEKIKQSF
jgi:flavodoxin